MRDQTPRYWAEHGWVAVLFDPEGGEHPCSEVTDPRYDANPVFWCAGRVGPSPAWLADRIHETWFEPTPWDSTYERQERAFTERFEQ